VARILIIEDDASIRLPLEDNLRLEGYEVSSAADGREGLTMALAGRYDLVILDLMLPKLDGFDVCREIRRGGNFTPILMLTARSQEIDKVLGLELGADDYVTKPFSPREVLARIRAILRRNRQVGQGAGPFCFGDVEVNFEKYEATKSGRAVALTALEFALLRLLVAGNGQVVHRDRIVDEVWGEGIYIEARTVDKHISLLRKKVEDDPQNPRFIVGVRGVGYKFVS
jgi:two-component system alkaline phosphatase synthesis response regulator PhoP